MPSQSFDTDRHFKYLTVITVLNVTFQLVSDITAGKIISIFGTGVSITVLYFPITYVIGDILTEVYGYSRARHVVWLTLMASIVAGTVYQLVVAVPAAPFFTSNEAYITVFGIVPRILIGGWLAVFAGDLVNDFVLAKMKIWTGGKMLWSRLIGSTIVGQFFNTAVFYTVGLYGVMPHNVLINGILMGWALKTLVEIIMVPVTYRIVSWLKKHEQVDYFDYDTNFNPFIINGASDREKPMRPASR